MTDPYYQHGGITIYHGDCREIADDLTFDVIVTDPPYGISYKQTIATGTDYGTIVGDENTALVEWLLSTFAKMPMVVFGANHFARFLPSTGRWLCWDKRLSEAADRMIGSPFELIWVAGDDLAGVMYRVQHGGVVNADGANIKRVHPTQKPTILMRRIIADHAAEGVILDPFAGSGSTLRASKDLGREAIGIEIEERYCEIAARRLGQEVLAL